MDGGRLVMGIREVTKGNRFLMVCERHDGGLVEHECFSRKELDMRFTRLRDSGRYYSIQVFDDWGVLHHYVDYDGNERSALLNGTTW